MKNVCMNKYPEHKPAVEIRTIRYVTYDGLHEHDIEYWYCERCKELLDKPETEEDNKIPF